MQHEFFFPLFGVGTIFVAWALVVWGNYLRQKNRVALHQVLSQQRLDAMEKGLPVPSGSLDDLLDRAPPRTPQQTLTGYRTAALAAGLLFVFSGLGMMLAFGVAEDMRDVWSIGLLPAMAGVGLLIFYRLARNLPTGDGDAEA